MNTKKTLLTAIFAIFAFATFLTACKEDVSVESVSVDPTTMDMIVDDVQTIKATVLPSDADDKTVSWTSSNTIVATVSGGEVTALAVGTTIITCTTNDGAKTDTTQVTVQPKEDYASLLVGNYVGNLTMSGQVVAENSTIVVVSDSRNKVTVSVDEEFYVAAMGGNVPMKVSCTMPVVKDGDEYHTAGTTTATMMGFPLPVATDAIFTPANNAIKMNINVSSIPVIGNVQVIFEGTHP